MNSSIDSRMNKSIDNSMDYVIIGNSTAAIGAIEGIRRYDRKNKIIIISDEPCHTYSRPLISYYLAGRVTAENMIYRDINFYEKNNVEAILGVKAASIDFTGKKIKLENGRNIEYAKLLIATGSKPFIPPVEGLGKEKIFNFIRYDDVRAIEKLAVKGAKAVVVGASFSGLKAVEALAEKGVEVTVIDIMSRIMPRTLDDTAAGIAMKVLRKHGIKVLLNNTVEKISGEKEAAGVVLKDGSEIACDFIILAIGVRCNTDLVKNTGLEISRGIVIDNRMQTNIPDVYAAGDVAEGYNCIENRRMEIAIIPNAYYQGETAGSNMAGEYKTFDEGLVMNSMPLFELSIASAGVSEVKEGMEVIIKHIAERDSYKKFYLSGGKLAGYLLVNDIDRAGIYTDLIRAGTDISAFKKNLADEDFGFISLSKEARREKLLKGGAA